MVTFVTFWKDSPAKFVTTGFTLVDPVGSPQVIMGLDVGFPGPLQFEFPVPCTMA